MILPHTHTTPSSHTHTLPLPPSQFHSQQLDKQQKAAKQALERQEFHRLQTKELAARRDATVTEEKQFVQKNMELLKVC